MNLRNKQFLFLPIFALLFMMGFTGCKKSCDLPENTYEGVIIDDAIVYPASGFMTENMQGNYHIHGNSLFADNFEMRLSASAGRTPVNYGAYSILANPMVVNCDSRFSRNVVVDPINGVATYTVTAIQCKNTKCEENRVIENYVVVPAIPESYTVLFVQDIIKK